MHGIKYGKIYNHASTMHYHASPTHYHAWPTHYHAWWSGLFMVFHTLSSFTQHSAIANEVYKKGGEISKLSVISLPYLRLPIRTLLCLWCLYNWVVLFKGAGEYCTGAVFHKQLSFMWYLVLQDECKVAMLYLWLSCHVWTTLCPFLDISAQLLLDISAPFKCRYMPHLDISISHMGKFCA